MSSHEPKNQDVTDYVLNPYTGRLIKKHSKTHKRLVAAKLLDTEPSAAEENVLIEADTKEEAKALQGKMNKKAQKNKVITRRGTKVLTAARRPTRQETIQKVSDFAVASVVEHRGALMEQDLTDEQMDGYIRNLIQRKLVGLETPTPPAPAAANLNVKRITTKQTEDGDEDV